MKVREAVAAGARRLAEVSETPRLDAELLMAHAMAVERQAMLLSHLDEAAPEAFEPLVVRRLQSEPVAYITGRRAFWTIELDVAPGVLIPRPDSETLIEAAVEHFAGTAGPRRILDLGTGSGALLLAALDQWPQAAGIGLDQSEEAIRIARHNVRRLGLRQRALIKMGTWTGLGGPHDLILCNPPYVAEDAKLPREVAAYEPPEALYSGRDGLDDYLAISGVLRPQLAAGGVACIEIGLGQRDRVSSIFAAQGFRVSVRRDLSGIERCLVLNP